jgi:hypothetical protein
MPLVEAGVGLEGRPMSLVASQFLYLFKAQRNQAHLQSPYPLPAYTQYSANGHLLLILTDAH